jgi:hypothetical protein
MNSYNLTEEQENAYIRSIVSSYFPDSGTPELEIVRSPIFTIGTFNEANFHSPYGKYIPNKEAPYNVFIRTFTVIAVDSTVQCCVTITHIPAREITIPSIL